MTRYTPTMPAPVRTTNSSVVRKGATQSGNQPLKPRRISTRLRVLLAGVAIALALLVQQNANAIANYLNRPVGTARIENELRNVSDGEVRELLAAYMGRGFFSLDVAGVKEALEEHPWIARASVKRVWPGSLSLSLTEELPIARWGEAALLNQYGEIFLPENVGDFTSIPMLVGPEDTQFEVMKQYQVLSQALFSSGLHLDELSLNRRGNWELGLDGGVHIVAGRHHVLDKLQRMLRVYEKGILNDMATIQRIDLRYSNGLTVQKMSQDSEVAAR
ncbi:MAG: cell division protein FtsQ/DivIB [Pseudohongiellaceae bacterium]